MADLSLMGMRLIEAQHLVVPTTVRRTWRERLFSWPWRPWVTIKQVYEPDPSMYRLGNDTLVGHPATIQRLKRHADD